MLCYTCLLLAVMILIYPIEQFDCCYLFLRQNVFCTILYPLSGRRYGIFVEAEV